MEKKYTYTPRTDRSKKILPLLREGKTVNEITELLGYASSASVYAYIHKNHLREKTRIAPNRRRSDEILPLLREGKTVEEIRKILGYKARVTVYDYLKKTTSRFPRASRPEKSAATIESAPKRKESLFRKISGQRHKKFPSGI